LVGGWRRPPADQLIRNDAGVNNFWAMGKHDKWKHFGLHWYGGLDGFTGKILWLVVLVE